jgi:hypothetical protein
MLTDILLSKQVCSDLDKFNDNIEINLLFLNLSSSIYQFINDINNKGYRASKCIEPAKSSI